MFPFFLSIESMLCKDFTLIQDPAAVKDLKKTNQPIFLIKNKQAYKMNFSNKKVTLAHEPCALLLQGAKLEEIFDAFFNYNYLLIQREEDLKIIGYLTLQTFLKQFLTHYEHLHAYIETILKTIDQSCTVIDDKQRVLFWTKGAEHIFSIKQDDIIGKPITNFFKTDHLEILNTLNKGTSVKNKQHQAREDLVVLINSQPVYYKDEIIGAVVSETDITSQVRLNNELYNASRRLFHLEERVNNDDPFQQIRGNSPKLKQTINLTKKAATTDAHILIQGESGVGKELFAKAIHQLREKPSAPYIAINCGAIPEALFESEMFGYEKGAFSGADQRGKKGQVELANNGTLFLDEIGEMPLDMQVKLLRLLQEKKFFRVGGTKEIEVDFRVIAATNKDLKALVDQGKFREDLYYRLNVVSLEIPPLRERPEDIIELTHYFLYECSVRYNRPIHGISQTMMQALLAYRWPGNIRELKNAIERLVVFSEEGKIHLEDLPFTVDADALQTETQTYKTSDEKRSLKERLEAYEREIITKELKKVDGNKLKCANNLKITRTTLYNKMHRLGIDL